MNAHPHPPTSRPGSDPVLDILAKLDLRIRHLEATADYVQGLEQRAESLEREVRILHGRVDALEQLVSRSSSPPERDVNEKGPGGSTHTASHAEVLL